MQKPELRVYLTCARNEMEAIVAAAEETMRKSVGEVVRVECKFDHVS